MRVCLGGGRNSPPQPHRARGQSTGPCPGAFPASSSVYLVLQEPRLS